MLLELPKSLEKDVIQFCNLNDIKDINEFLTNCLSKGYNIFKYGMSPKDNFEKENKPLEIEKYEEKENVSQGLEGEEKKRRPGRPKKVKEKEEVKPIEEVEPIKVKKKIRIIKS